MKKKAVAYATKLPSNTSEANVSDEMTTTCVLLKILNMASNVRDDHLKEAALARLCSHVTAGQMGHREYVINLEFIYRADDHTAYVQEIRKILLPALLNLSAAICASPLREDYFKLMSTHPKLNHDHRMAVYYRKYVLGEGQEEEEED